MPHPKTTLGRLLAGLLTTAALLALSGGALAQVNLDAQGAPTIFKGNPPQRCPSKNGEGDVQASWPNGETRYKGECKGGLMVGKWKAWHANGETHWKAKLVDGQFRGTFKSWHPTGKKMARISYADSGLRDGTFKAWHRNGKQSVAGKYIKGVQQGCWESWHPNGQKRSKGTYADGQRVLTWLSWSPTGTKGKDKLGGTATHGKCLITL